MVWPIFFRAKSDVFIASWPAGINTPFTISNMMVDAATLSLSAALTRLESADEPALVMLSTWLCRYVFALFNLSSRLTPSDANIVCSLPLSTV